VRIELDRLQSVVSLGNLYDVYFSFHFRNKTQDNRKVSPQMRCCPWIRTSLDHQPTLANTRIDILLSSKHYREALELPVTDTRVIGSTQRPSNRDRPADDYSQVYSLIPKRASKHKNALEEKGEALLPNDVRFTMYALALPEKQQNILLEAFKKIVIEQLTKACAVVLREMLVHLESTAPRHRDGTVGRGASQAV
jgi:hypothetical protein